MCVYVNPWRMCIRNKRKEGEVGEPRDARLLECVWRSAGCMGGRGVKREQAWDWKRLSDL